MKKKLRNEKVAKFLARKGRVSRSLVASRRPRLTVYRSARHIYALLVEPDTGRTLASVSTRTSGMAGGGDEGGKVAAAKKVGQVIAEKARERQIEEVVFNRNGFLFHGRVKALAEGAREAGLRF